MKVSMDIPSGSTMRRWDGKSFRWCKAHDDLFPHFPGERWANVGEEKVMWSQWGTMARRPGMQTRSSTRREAKWRNAVETRNDEGTCQEITFSLILIILYRITHIPQVQTRSNAK